MAQTGGMSLSAVRRAANVLNLSTPFGLLVARLGGAEVTVDDEGVFWAEGYRLPFPVAGAFTVGNVVITGSRLDLRSVPTRSATPGSGCSAALFFFRSTRSPWPGPGPSPGTVPPATSSSGLLASTAAATTPTRSAVPCCGPWPASAEQ